MPFDFHNRDRIDHLLEEIEELRYKDRRDLIRLLLLGGRRNHRQPGATGGRPAGGSWAFAGKAGTATTG